MNIDGLALMASVVPKSFGCLVLARFALASGSMLWVMEFLGRDGSDFR